MTRLPDDPWLSGWTAGIDAGWQLREDQIRRHRRSLGLALVMAALLLAAGVRLATR